ncbi:MAG: hypothetical protein ACOYJA_06555 [Christensenellales bacterium]
MSPLTQIPIHPIGAPWGGPESVACLSAFASVALCIQGREAFEPLYCTAGKSLLCTGCGQCGPAFDRVNKLHEQIYHQLLTLTTLSCRLLFVPFDWAAALTERVDRPDFWQGLLAWCGYTGGWTDRPEAMRASLAAGVPVLAQGGDRQWRVLSGEADGRPLCAGPALAGWDALARGLIVTGRRPPRQVDCALMNALADCLEASDAAHASALELLGDDARAQPDPAAQDEARAQPDPAAQDEAYAQLHGFVGMAAEQRCFGAFAFFCGLYGQTPEALFTPCQAIAQDMMQIHNLCWQVWAAMGGDHRCDPAAHAEAFAAPEPRRRAARLLNRIRQCDRDNAARLRALAASLAEAQG